MSILPMKKLTLIGMESEKKQLLTAFSRSKMLHLINMEAIEDTSRNVNPEQTDDTVKKMVQIDDAMTFIKQSLDKKQNQIVNSGDKKTKVAVKLTGRKVEVDFNDFLASDSTEVALFDSVIYPLNQYKHRLSEIDGEKAKLLSQIDSLDIYRDLDVSFLDLADTQHTSMLLGIAVSINDEDIEQLIVSHPDVQFAVIGTKGTNTALLVVCHKEQTEEMQSVLAQWSFTRCILDYNVTPMEYISYCQGKINNLDKEKESIFDKTCSHREDLPKLKTLYDYYSFCEQLNQTGRDICSTQKAYVLQGWYLLENEQKLLDLLDKKLTVKCYDLAEPLADEKAPTIVRQPKIIQPFTAITDMYSLPDYHEADPNLFVAVFYWLFMGLMMGDVGYGVIMALAGLLFIKMLKPEGGFRNVIIIIAYSGVATIIWGVLLGGWFAISFPEGSIFSPVLLSPLTNPLGMIEICVILGTLHLMCGLIMKAINLARNKQYLDIFCDCVSWIIFEAGFILAVIGAFSGLLKWEGDFSLITNIGLYMMLAALVIVLFTAGREKKGLGKVVGGLGGVYGVINLLSDILSYLRLFGLGLTTGVIGMVFNTLAGLLLAKVYLFPLGILVLLFGHGLNIAINLLGAYVHDARLQHIEFFGKFYTGDGLAFRPIAGETKYIKFNQQ